MSKHPETSTQKIFGDSALPPWAQRTEEEKRQGMEQFFTLLHADDLDAEVDQLFNFIRENREVPFPRGGTEEADAA